MSDFALSGDLSGRSLRFLRLSHAWRTLLRELFDPYRPELHYMRGPGPKWREKHDSRRQQSIAAPDLDGLYESR